MPKVLINIAPNGAVNTMAITAIVSNIVPYSMYLTLSSSLMPLIDAAVSKTTPPIAAYTVALGIHANAIKARSFNSYLPFSIETAVYVAIHLKNRPTRMTAIAFPTTLPSILSN